VYGVVEVRSPRFGPCRCSVASRRTITPVAEIMPDRCTPEYERTLAKMGSVLPYRRARSLLDEFFPLGDAPEVETIRQRTLHVGARLERAAVALPTSAPPTEAKSITLTIDGGHVKAVRSYQGRSFEVFVAQVSNDNGRQVVFSSLPAEADRQTLQQALLANGELRPGTILGGPSAQSGEGPIMSNAHKRSWHHNSVFGDGPRQPLNRDERARFKFLLNAHHKAGRITRACRDIGLALLKRLGTTGRCDPSHATLAADAGCKTAKTAERATAALKALGLLSWVRRLVRTSATGWRAEQTSNQYCLLPSLTSLNAPRHCDRQNVAETNSFDRSKESSFVPLFSDDERAAALAALAERRRVVLEMLTRAR
jgi:hypothetical protein